MKPHELDPRSAITRDRQRLAELDENLENLRTGRQKHAFHSDGEPCEQAVITGGCLHNHAYGRTWSEASSC